MVARSADHSVWAPSGLRVSRWRYSFALCLADPAFVYLYAQKRPQIESRHREMFCNICHRGTGGLLTRITFFRQSARVRGLR